MKRLAIPICAWLTMGCVDVLEDDGAFDASLGRADLTPVERVLIEERFGSDFAEAARLGVAADALFGFARCDLNGADPPELLAVGRSPSHCFGIEREGPAACGFWALAETPEGWVEVLETAGAMRVAETTTNGWRDLVAERGGLPAVYKFSGSAYLEDVGDAEPVPEVLSDWDDYLWGRPRIDWYDFDDAMPRVSEDAFLWFYATQMRQVRVGALPDAFRVGVLDLDGVPPEETVVQGITPQFCDTGGCAHWLLEGPHEDRPARIIGELTGFDLRLAATWGSSGRDLVATGAGGLEVWRNDGEGWKAAVSSTLD